MKDSKKLTDNRKKTNRSIIIRIGPFTIVFKDRNHSWKLPRRKKAGFRDTLLKEPGQNR